MLGQPLLSCNVVGHRSFDAAPERLVVARFEYVHELVHDHVVDDPGRELQCPPVKVERRAPARPPAEAKILNTDGPRLDADARRVPDDPASQPRFTVLDVPVDEVLFAALALVATELEPPVTELK